jgi:hypothetical protein
MQDMSSAITDLISIKSMMKRMASDMKDATEEDDNEE